MAPIDGAIGMKININHPQTTDVNIHSVLFIRNGPKIRLVSILLHIRNA